MKKIYVFVTDSYCNPLQTQQKNLPTSPKHTLNLQSCAYFLLLEKGTTSVLADPLKRYSLKVSLWGGAKKTKASHFTRK